MVGIYEGAIYRENFMISTFQKVIEKLFASREKSKNEGKDLMQNLVKLIMNSLYGVQIRKDIDQFLKFKSEHLMQRVR